MAAYKYVQFLEQSSHVVFDQLHGPGQPAPFSGIYRCEGCGHNAVAPQGAALPAQDHPQHPPDSTLQWRLIALAR